MQMNFGRMLILNKILLNGLHYEKNGAGISKYTQMLIKQFISEKYDVDILIRNEFKNDYDASNVIVSAQDINGSKDRIIYEQIKSKKLYDRYELVHFPDYATPVLYRGYQVATIHDMAMHTMKDKYTRMQNITKNILLKNTIRNADKLICVSEFSKNELIKYYPDAEKRSVVIYEGIEIPNLKIDQDIEGNILKEFGLSGEGTRYILYVGTIAPHKNIKRLISAFGRINHLIPEYKLVIAGKKGWMYSDVFEEVEKLSLSKRVVFTDFADETKLEVLYSNAEIFVSASLYEGFGFPPLEAMIRKIPVLVSDIEIFRETCINVAEYFNPMEIEDIADKMLKLIRDESKKIRLAEAGYERARFFSWEKTARETFEIYKSILDK